VLLGGLLRYTADVGQASTRLGVRRLALTGPRFFLGYNFFQDEGAASVGAHVLLDVGGGKFKAIA
jgi:hypothetical protein